jgi:peptidoglycan/xylan/chitin deacetylase (PgdA/CDA1 family)
VPTRGILVVLRKGLRVLCYHSIGDLDGAPVIEQYGVPPHDFRKQIQRLRRFGFTFVTLDAAVCYIRDGSPLPRSALLLTFDDCYVDLLREGLPILQEGSVPAAAFAVAGLLGKTNEWDVPRGAPTMSLLGRDGLEQLRAAGVDIGVHGYSHQLMNRLDGNRLDVETRQALDVLHDVCSGSPITFAYPHGNNNRDVRRAVEAAGFDVSFTVTPGLVRYPVKDLFAIDRIEIMRRDGHGLRFVAKVVFAGYPTWTMVHRRMRNLLTLCKGKFSR